MNSTIGNLNEQDGIECPDCLNKGYIYAQIDGRGVCAQECRCMAKRRSVGRIRRSGLGELLDRYTLETWEEKSPLQSRVKQMAQNYAAGAKGWFYLGGRPGTGKTHLCTAVCSVLMNSGHETRYVLWRELLIKAQALRFDDAAREQLLDPLKTVKVLYLDDLFKTKQGDTPKSGDVELAFEILNARYNNSELLTIISSEFTIEQILDLDEGLGSRIRERAKGHCADLSGGVNWRMN